MNSGILSKRLGFLLVLWGLIWIQSTQASILKETKTITASGAEINFELSGSFSDIEKKLIGSFPKILQSLSLVSNVYPMGELPDKNLKPTTTHKITTRDRFYYMSFLDSKILPSLMIKTVEKRSECRKGKTFATCKPVLEIAVQGPVHVYSHQRNIPSINVGGGSTSNHPGVLNQSFKVGLKLSVLAANKIKLNIKFSILGRQYYKFFRGLVKKGKLPTVPLENEIKLSFLNHGSIAFRKEFK